jgi:protein-tyrosine-phosphatase
LKDDYLKKKRILFVCSGNTCRSPMAEALAREISRREYGEAVHVSSAGVFALPGAPATPEAVEALLAAGIDLQGHRAALLSTALVEEADLVLTMTAVHRRQVLQLMPNAAHKVHVLADYAGWGGDLEDPIGRPPAVYRECASRLRTLVTAALARFARTGPTGES